MVHRKEKEFSCDSSHAYTFPGLHIVLTSEGRKRK